MTTTRRADVNAYARDYIEDRVSAETFFADQRKRAREIATRGIDARIARKLRSAK